ncbi:MAG: Crp/Fnr family transcriptional regulator [Rubrivivax sp.]|nr:Crp/Fnr family transcriptional regulator [Rubrivivax sp.]
MLMKTVPPYLQSESHPQARVCAACEVRSGALFGALDPKAIVRIHADIEDPELAAETRIYARGEPGTAVYTVRSGIVRFQRVTDSGDRRIVRLAGRGDLIGQEALLDQPYADEAVACTPVQLCRIPRDMVGQMGRANTELMRELMRRWQQALEQAGAWAAELSTGVARRRVLKLLGELARLADDRGEIWMPRREDMGAMLGLTVETASRMVSQLRREGVLQSLSQRRAVLNPAALAAALQAI